MLAIKPANAPTITRSIPALETEIGERAAKLLLQIEHWISISSSEIHDGKQWTYQSTVEIREKAFPEWSLSTINRTIHKLETLELIHVGNFNTAKYDKTRWFALNQMGIARLKSIILGDDEPRTNQGDARSNHHELRSTQDEPRSNHSEPTIPEIPTKISSEIPTKMTSTTTPAPDAVVVVSDQSTPFEKVQDFKTETPERRPSQAGDEGTDDLMEAVDLQPSPPAPNPVPLPLPPRHRLGEFFKLCSDHELDDMERQFGATVIDAWIEGVKHIPGIRSEPAFVRDALTKGTPPPVKVTRPDEQDSKRYIEGKYANIIKH